MRYTILTLITLIYFINLQAQDCATVKGKLLEIAKLKVAYEKTMDRDMVKYFKREDKNYDPDIAKARNRYMYELSKIKVDKSAKGCIEFEIFKNDTTNIDSKDHFIDYQYHNPFSSIIYPGTYITYDEYLKAFHHSLYVSNADTLLHTKKIPALSYLYEPYPGQRERDSINDAMLKEYMKLNRKGHR